MDTFSVDIWKRTYEMRADFSDGACPVLFRQLNMVRPIWPCEGENLEEDGWYCTGKQVVDYHYLPITAMRAYLESIAREQGKDPEDEDVIANIDRAIGEMQCRDDLSMRTVQRGGEMSRSDLRYAVIVAVTHALYSGDTWGASKFGPEQVYHRAAEVAVKQADVILAYLESEDQTTAERGTTKRKRGTTKMRP